MQVPLQVAFKDVPPDAAIEEACRLEAGKLERYHDRITRCRVVVSMPHHGGKRGSHWVIRVELSVPGKEIVVHRDPEEHRDLELPARAVREAFDAARRRLEDHLRRLRGQVKAHAEPEHGRVKELDRPGGTGLIERPDGTEIRFHRAGVVGSDWNGIDQGTEVRFAVEDGEGGQRACSVRVVGRHHHLT